MFLPPDAFGFEVFPGGVIDFRVFVAVDYSHSVGKKKSTHALGRLVESWKHDPARRFAR
jgi:hypothetical protein